MGEWKYRCNVKPLTQKYEDDGDLNAFWTAFDAELIKSLPGDVRTKMKAQEFWENMREAIVADDVDEFDFEFDYFYDWADRERVWVGA